MTAVDHAELKRAEALLESRCKAIDQHYDRFPDSVDRTMEDTAKAIRLVLSSRTALLSEIEGLKSYAKDAANEALEYRRQLAALRTQAPDSWRPDRGAVAALVKAAATEGIRSYCLEYDFNLELWTNKAMRNLALRPQTAESGT